MEAENDGTRKCQNLLFTAAVKNFRGVVHDPLDPKTFHIWDLQKLYGCFQNRGTPKTPQNDHF